MMMLLNQFGRSGSTSWVLWLFLNALVHHFQCGFAGERYVTSHHLVQDQAIRIESLRWSAGFPSTCSGDM